MACEAFFSAAHAGRKESRENPHASASAQNCSTNHPDKIDGGNHEL